MASKRKAAKAKEVVGGPGFPEEALSNPDHPDYEKARAHAGLTTTTKEMEAARKADAERQGIDTSDPNVQTGEPKEQDPEWRHAHGLTATGEESEKLRSNPAVQREARHTNIRSLP